LALNVVHAHVLKHCHGYLVQDRDARVVAGHEFLPHHLPIPVGPCCASPSLVLKQGAFQSVAAGLLPDHGEHSRCFDQAVARNVCERVGRKLLTAGDHQTPVVAGEAHGVHDFVCYGADLSHVGILVHIFGLRSLEWCHQEHETLSGPLLQVRDVARL